MILHVKADSFYAACERLFRPDLADKPIVVLSNRGGLIMSLNDEARRRGFHEGDSWARLAGVPGREEISVFDSNYDLYADISSRLVGIYNRLCPEVEVLSMDSAFLWYPDRGCPDFSGIGTHLGNTVLREIGIPVSVGIARTRTLAAIAGSLAGGGNGVYLCEGHLPDSVLADCPAAQIWGIARTRSGVLERLGIRTAFDLKTYPANLAAKNLSADEKRTIRELNGIEESDPGERVSNPGISCSESFTEPVSSLSSLECYLSSSVLQAGRRPKGGSFRASFISVYLVTDPGDGTGGRLCAQMSARLDAPTSSLPDIIKSANRLLRRIYRPGYPYRTLMINLLAPDDDSAGNFGGLFSHERFTGRTSRYGRGSLLSGMQAPELRARSLKRRFLSPAYTTDLSGIPDVF